MKSFLLFVLSSLIGVVQAATYYVAPNGANTNPGTLVSPFATLQKAHDVANPGDTIYMRGGNYVAKQVAISRNGTAGAYINVFNYPGEVPVLDAVNDNRAGAAVIRVGDSSWWHFKGLMVQNGYAHGIYLAGTSSNNIVEQCNVHNNTRVQASGAGIIIEAGSNNLILNNDSHHNGVYGTSGGDGIDVNSPGTGNVVRGNRLWRNNDDGVDLWGSKGVLVENNWSWENGKKDDLTASGGDGTGFKLGGGGAANGLHTIQNNLAWRNKGNGFDNNSATLTINVFNNTSWDNGTSNFSFYSPVAYVLKNNLSFPRAFIYIPATQVVQKNNTWNLNVTVDTTDFASLDYSAAAGPRNADGSLPVLNFLKLVAGSNLLDKGLIDLGSYEWSTGSLGRY